jgi:hypothetical protein
MEIRGFAFQVLLEAKDLMAVFHTSKMEKSVRQRFRSHVSQVSVIQIICALKLAVALLVARLTPMTPPSATATLWLNVIMVWSGIK